MIFHSLNQTCVKKLCISLFFLDHNALYPLQSCHICHGCNLFAVSWLLLVYSQSRDRLRKHIRIDYAHLCVTMICMSGDLSHWSLRSFMLYRGLLSETSKRGPTIGTDFLNVSNSRLHNNDNLLPFDGRTQAPVNALSKNPCRAISAAFVTSPFISIYPRAQWTILTAHWSPRADLITFIIEFYSCSKRLTIDTKGSLALIKLQSRCVL